MRRALPAIQPLTYLIAVHKAILKHPHSAPILDWKILQASHEAEKVISFRYIYKAFHGISYHGNNSNYYNALERLTRKGLLVETKNPSGWRRWEITLKGKRALADLNKQVLTYLPQPGEQSLHNSNTHATAFS